MEPEREPEREPDLSLSLTIKSSLKSTSEHKPWIPVYCGSWSEPSGSVGVNINDKFCSQLVSCIVRRYQVLVAVPPVTKTMPDIKREETKG